MKKIIYQMILVLAATLVFSSSWAQLAYQRSSVATPSESTTVISDNVSNETAVTVSSVDAKVLKAFNKHFKNIDNQKWYLVNQDYLASFPVSDRQVMAWFSKNGQMNYAVYYGSEKHLPAQEKKMVESNYGDYLITATQEIQSPTGTAWVATLESHATILKVKITENGLEEMERIKKSK